MYDAFQVPGDGVRRLNRIVPPGEFVTLSNSGHTITTPEQTIFLSTGNSNRTVTLPILPVYEGTHIQIRKTDGVVQSNVGAIVVATPSSEKIDNASTFIIRSNFETVELVGDDTNWHVINQDSYLDGEMRRLRVDDTDINTTPPSRFIFLDSPTADRTITMPDARLYRGITMTFINDYLAPNTMTVVPYLNTQLIDGASSIVLSALDARTVLSDGSLWWIIGAA